MQKVILFNSFRLVFIIMPFFLFVLRSCFAGAYYFYDSGKYKENLWR